MAYSDHSGYAAMAAPRRPKQIEADVQERCKTLFCYQHDEVHRSSLATSVNTEAAAVIITSLYNFFCFESDIDPSQRQFFLTNIRPCIKQMVAVLTLYI